MKKEKKIDPACHLCQHVTEIASLDQWICKKKGLVNPTSRCFRFKYDPLKRPVFPGPTLPSFTNDDFRLD